MHSHVRNTSLSWSPLNSWVCAVVLQGWLKESRCCPRLLLEQKIRKTTSFALDVPRDQSQDEARNSNTRLKFYWDKLLFSKGEISSVDFKDLRGIQENLCIDVIFLFLSFILSKEILFCFTWVNFWKYGILKRLIADIMFLRWFVIAEKRNNTL